MKRFLTYLLLFCIGGICIVLWNPVHSKFYNLVLVGGVLGVWFSCVGLATLAKRKHLTTALLFVPLVPSLLVLLMKPEPIDPESLRPSYLDELVDFTGSTYVWGGEAQGGIDCSGLPRRALRNALFSYAFKEWNKNAFTHAIEHWWFDASARALSEGYRNYVQPLDVEGAVIEMDYSRLEPGDLAVDISGLHVLVYLGGDNWIQAAPEVGEVKVFKGRTGDNVWLRRPAKAYRWSILGD